MKKILLILIATASIMLTGCTSKDTIKTTSLNSVNTIYLTDAHQDSLVVSINIEYPTAFKTDSVLAKIQSDLKYRLFGEAYIEMNEQQALEAYVAMLKTEYKNNNLPIKEDWLNENALADGEDDQVPFFCEEQLLSGAIMSSAHNILSYCVERYVYMGGAHGSNFRQFVNYDLATGAQLDEKDIFTEGYEAPLTDLLLKYMVEQNDDIELIKDLEEAGYNVDDIHPNDNFYLSEEGITYVFNPYDIAPYALGETEITIPWEALQDILNKDVINRN